MVAELDPRVVILGIEDQNGTPEFFTGLAIHAVGIKYTNDLCAEAEIQVFNLKKETRDYLISKTSPYKLNNFQPINLTLDVGRESTGTFRLFTGNVIAGTITQPPDIGIIFRSLTAAFWLAFPTAVSHPAVTPLKNIAQQVATSMGLSLNFLATPKNISNYSFTGGTYRQVSRLAEAGGVDAYVDGTALVVKDKGASVNQTPRVLNRSNGLIGIPQVTERGILAKMLIDNTVTLGSKITIQSDLNPAANGTFTIYKLSFDVASRDTPFYYLAECTRTLI